MRPVLLVNANTVRPPVSPVGLDYVGHALLHAGIPVKLLDLAFEPDWQAALSRALSTEPLWAGIAVRNTDDCCYATSRSFLPWAANVVSQVKRLTSSPVVLGGAGFSVFPEDVLRYAGADLGIYGEGEEAAVLLSRALEAGDSLEDVPNLVRRRDGAIVRHARRDADLSRAPLPRRRFVDNPRYQAEGAMVGLETKRGCPKPCTFCADPVAKGSYSRLRPPRFVADEVEDLAAQGVAWYHLCDPEFNIPLEHAKEVCRRLIDRGLGGKVAWYTYCAPLPFDRELAMLMKRAGCAGINFGVDSLEDGQLRRLGREHRVKHVEELVGHMRAAGLNFMFDLMLAGPGETEATVRATVDSVRRLELPLVGVAVGLRVYPGTALARQVAGPDLRKGLRPGPDVPLWQPVFFTSPALGEDPLGLVRRVAEGDPRFMMLAAPSAGDNYNYVNDDSLDRAIAAGARGAYWDILRKLRAGTSRNTPD